MAYKDLAFPLRGKWNLRLERGFNGVRRGKAAEFDSAMRRFESHAVRSPGCYFPVGENRRHSRGLGWGEPVSGRQLPVFRSVRGGFWAPGSAVVFPISVSAVQRPVRLLTETGSRSALRVSGATPGSPNKTDPAAKGLSEKGL